MNVKALITIILICFTASSCSRMNQLCLKGNLNPIQYGLNKAKSDIERYYIIQRTHQEAQKMGVGVSYKGIKEIKIEIPKNATSIPLTHFTDFYGATFLVHNRQKDMFLFELSTELTEVEVEGNEVDGRHYSENERLNTGQKLLVLSDDIPWVNKRIGHDYGATRKDLILIRNGRGRNGPICSYCTTSSRPHGAFCNVVNRKKIFKNITFSRTGNSTHKTYLIKMKNQYNVELSKVIINTPKNSELFGDRAISIVNCMDVVLKDVVINGTYSQTSNAEYGKKFGYGIMIDNTYNIKVDRMYARANWGVFGTNNVHKAYLENCDINRFDIHCYGKDISFKECNFVDKYNSFGSVYGLVSFDRCTFTNFKPVLFGNSYNAYVGFDVRFNRCTFNMDSKHNSIISFSGFCKETNMRPELKKKCLPNVYILNCRINLEPNVNKWYVFDTKSTFGYNGVFYYINDVIISRSSPNNSSSCAELFNRQVKTANDIHINNK